MKNTEKKKKKMILPLADFLYDNKKLTPAETQIHIVSVLTSEMPECKTE